MKPSLVLLWMLGSVRATAVAWTGVSVVSNELINPPPGWADRPGGGHHSVRHPRPAHHQH